MNRNHAIDLWKFVCALCLILYHFKQVLGSHVADTYYDLIAYFNLVVEWFFMISGYMVCVSDNKWFKTAPSDKPEEKRFLYRFKRLYPMFFIATIAAAVIMYVYKSVTGVWWWEEGMQHGIFNLILSLTCMTYTGIFSPDPIIGINSPTWFMDALILCYMIYYLIRLISRKKNISPVWLYAFVMFLGFYAWYQMTLIPFLNKDMGRGYAAFFLGCFIHELAGYFSKKKMQVFTIVAAAVFVLLRLLGHADDMYFIVAYVEGALLLLLFTQFDFPSKLIGFIPGTAAMGGASYEVFLWHLPVMNLLALVWHLTGYTEYKLPDFAIYTVCVLAVSFGMYFLVEKKLLSGKKAKTSSM